MPKPNLRDIRMPDGTLVRNVPDNISRDQFLAGLKKKGADVTRLLTPREEENALEKVPVIGDLLAGVADVPLRGVMGVGNILKTLTDTMGAGNAASESIANEVESLRGMTSSESREAANYRMKRLGEAEGVGDSLRAAGDAFLSAPLDVTAEVLGSAVPFVASSVLTGGGAAGAAAAGALGTASGVGTIKGSIYEKVKSEFAANGVPEDKAETIAAKAQAYGGENLDSIALGGLLGAIASATGVTSNISKGIIARITAREAGEGAAEGVAKEGLLKSIGKGVVTEAVPEAAQAGQEAFAGNLAAQREGLDTPLMEGVLSNAAFEGLAGGVLGGMTGPMGRSQGAATPAADTASAAPAPLPENLPPEDKEQIRGLYESLVDSGLAPEEAIQVAVFSYGQEKEKEAARRGFVNVGVNVNPEIPGSVETTPPSEEASPITTNAPPPMAEQEAVAEMEAPAAQIQETPEPEITTSTVPAPSETPATEVGGNVPPPAAPVKEEETPPAVVPVPSAPAPSYTPMAAFQEANVRFPESDALATMYYKGLLATPLDEYAQNYSSEEEKAAYAEGAQKSGAEPANRNSAPEVGTTTDQAAGEGVPPVGAIQLTEAGGDASVVAPNELPPTEEVPAARKKLTVAKPKEAAPAPEETQELEAEQQAAFSLDGVTARKVAPAAAKGVKPTRRGMMNSQAGRPVEGAAALTEGMQLQQALMGGMDENGVEQAGLLAVARSRRLISQAEQAEIIESLRTPFGTDKDGNEVVIDKEKLRKNPIWRRIKSASETVEKTQAKIKKLKEKHKEDSLPVKAAETELADNQKTLDKLQAQLVRGAYDTMMEYAELRQDEIKGATQRVGDAKVQRRLGEMEGKSTAAEAREERDAKIEMTEARASSMVSIDGVVDAEESARVSAAVKGKSFEEVAQWLVDVAPDGFRKILAQRIQQAARNMMKGGVTFDFQVFGMSDPVPPGKLGSYLMNGSRGVTGYNLKKGRTYVWLNDHDTEDSGTSYTTVLHEFLHAVTSLALDFGADKSSRGTEFRKNSDDLIEVTDFIRQHIVEAYERGLDLPPLVQQFLAENNNAFTDQHEVLAWALSNPDMQRYLDTIPYKGKGSLSLWSKLVQAMRKFLRLSPGYETALEEVIRVTDAITDMSAPAYAAMLQKARGSTESSPKSVVNKAATSKAKAKKAQKKTSKVLRGVAAQADRDPEAAILGVEDLMEARKESNYTPALKERWKGFNESSKAFLSNNVLSTTALLEVTGLKDFEPAQRLWKTVRSMSAMRSNLSNSMSQTVERLGKFIVANKGKQEILGDMMAAARLSRVSAEQFEKKDKLDDVLADDVPLQVLEGKLLQPNLNAKQTKSLNAQIAARKAHITTAWKMWQALGKVSGAQDMYKAVRDMHRNAYFTRRAMLEKFINTLDIDPDAKTKMLEAIQLEQEDINAPLNKDNTDPLFPDVPLAAFPREYFPFRRFGHLYLRMHFKGGDKITIFGDSHTDLRLLRNKIAAERGIDPEDTGAFDPGFVSEMHNDMASDSGVMKRIFAILDDVDATGMNSADVPAAVEMLKDEIFQTVVMARPEGAFRKQFLHSKDRWGFSGDIYRVTAASVNEYANSIAKLKFKNDLDNDISAAKDAMDGMPPSEKMALKIPMEALKDRTKLALNPKPHGKIATFINRVTFTMLLTGPATAAVQMTQIPVRVFPRLAKDHSYAAASKVLIKYSNVFKSLGRPHRVTRAGVSLWEGPSLRNSKMVTSQPHLAAGYDHMHFKWNAFNTYASDTLDLSEMATNKSLHPAMRLKKNVMWTMQALFNGSEKLSREIAAMAAYELEYNKLEGKGLSQEERVSQAGDAAMGIVDDTMFHYGAENRAPWLQGDLGRVVSMFKFYALRMTEFMVRNMRAIFKGPDRAAALAELSGVILLGSLFHGAVGLPLYGVMTAGLGMLLKGLDDEEDERARSKDNPYTAYDLDYQFRYNWLPDTFGHIMVPGADGKQHTLANVLANGPLSELSDINFGSRTSMSGMWFRPPQGDNDSAVDWFVNSLISNIPGASTTTNFARGIDMMKNGEMQRGIEQFLPAFFKGAVVAERIGSDGATTLAGEQIKEASDFTAMNLFMQSLGFQATDLAQRQNLRGKINRLKKDRLGDRTKLTGQYKKAVLEGARDEALVALDKIGAYNRRQTDPTLLISTKDLGRSVSGAEGRRKYNINGVDLDKDDFGYFYDDIREVAEN